MHFCDKHRRQNVWIRYCRTSHVSQSAFTLLQATGHLQRCSRSKQEDLTSPFFHLSKLQSLCQSLTCLNPCPRAVLYGQQTTSSPNPSGRTGHPVCCWSLCYCAGLLCTTDPSGSPDTVEAGAPAAEGAAGAVPADGAVPEGAVPEGVGPRAAAAAAAADVTSRSACAAAPPPHTESAGGSAQQTHMHKCSQAPGRNSLLVLTAVVSQMQACCGLHCQWD